MVRIFKIWLLLFVSVISHKAIGQSFLSTDGNAICTFSSQLTPVGKEGSPVYLNGSISMLGRRSFIFEGGVSVSNNTNPYRLVLIETLPNLYFSEADALLRRSDKANQGLFNTERVVFKFKRSQGAAMANVAETEVYKITQDTANQLNWISVFGFLNGTVINLDWKSNLLIYKGITLRSCPF